MKIKIIVDSREKNLYGIIKDRDLDIYNENIEIIREQLDIGDIHISFSYNNNNYLYIYERKTNIDLISSIKDGRYKEQKSRLLVSGATSINYIIEGDTITSIKNKNNQKITTSAYIHSIYRDKINVIFSNDIEDTVTLILLVTIKIIEKPENFIIINNYNNDNSNNYIDYCKIKTEKNKNIDKNTCYLLQLSQIPSISKEIAKNIYNHYPSLISLITALNESENKIELLMKIDKIGKTKATTIINYLL